MLGSIFKYTAVLVIGAVGFATASHYMDIDTIDQIKKELDDHKATLQTVDVTEIKGKMNQFITTRRAEWVGRLNFASSIKDLDTTLNVWN